MNLELPVGMALASREKSGLRVNQNVQKIIRDKMRGERGKERVPVSRSTSVFTTGQLISLFAEISWS